MRLTPASGATRVAVAAVAALVVIAVLALAPGRARAIAPPQLSSGAAILVDADGGQKLFGQNPNSRRAIAPPAGGDPPRNPTSARSATRSVK